MSWLIMNDEIDYNALWYPTHIVSEDKKLIRVFVGASQTMLKGLVGLWVRDEDYFKIRHDKAYIFIHNPEATDDDIEHINWDDIPDVNDNKTTGREHLHLWKEPDFNEIANQSGSA